MHCPGGNAIDPIWRVLASSQEISSWTPLKPKHSIPCWLSAQWEPSVCRSCQCCQKKGSSKVCGRICSVWPSWVLESQHAFTRNSVSWSLGHSSKSSFQRSSPEHQEVWGSVLISLTISLLSWQRLSFWSSCANLPHLQFLINNCVYNAHTGIKLCTYCLYRHTTVLIHEIFIWPINSGVLTSLLLPQLSSSLTDALPSLNLLCQSKTDARFMQDAPKADWSIPYVSVAFFFQV